MSLQERIDALAALGKTLAAIDDETREDLFLTMANENPWFTPGNVQEALNSVTAMLDADALQAWVQPYGFIDAPAKSIGVIMAGNLPFVGFHDALSVLISGNKLLAKLSSQDKALPMFVLGKLMEQQPAFAERIEYTERLKDFDAVIATGSNNSSRYFDYYFSRYPHIIRGNRNSVAVLDGNETKADFQSLATDLFRYFGLGCRSVSKLMVPRGYSFIPLLDEIENWQAIANHHKYANNYDYNKAIYLVNREQHLDNGFLLLKESDKLTSPISVVFYEEYDGLEQVQAKLQADAANLQCVATNAPIQLQNIQQVALGQTQYPTLTDYADGVDTLAFLRGLQG